MKRGKGEPISNYAAGCRALEWSSRVRIIKRKRPPRRTFSERRTYAGGITRLCLQRTLSEYDFE